MSVWVEDKKLEWLSSTHTLPANTSYPDATHAMSYISTFSVVLSIIQAI